MKLEGKKVGKFRVSTVLATYDLDVWLSMENNVFTIHVPEDTGGKIIAGRWKKNL